MTTTRVKSISQEFKETQKSGTSIQSRASKSGKKTKQTLISIMHTLMIRTPVSHLNGAKFGDSSKTLTAVLT